MIKPALTATTLMLTLASAQAQLPESFNPGQYSKPNVCPTGYDFDAANSACELNPTLVAALKNQECQRAGFKFESGKCSVGDAAVPSPACAALPGYTPKIEAGACTYQRAMPVSTAGQFVNDCLLVLSPPTGSRLTQGSMYVVTEQEAQQGGDSLLTLAPGEIDYLPLHCKQLPGPSTEVLASQVARAAKRYGYTWGVLSMPYKWFPKQKAFVTGAPVGAYVGWRMAQAAAGTTFAAAATLSSVKADAFETDAAGQETITGSTEVAALSFALGVIWDITKDKRTTPFKAGVFIGQDLVNEAPGIRYPHNRKTYVAIQIGYNFTDN